MPGIYLPIGGELVKASSKIQISTAENELDIKKLEVEARTKRELMQFEYDLNVKLKAMELDAQKQLVDKQGQTQKEVADKKFLFCFLGGQHQEGGIKDDM